MKSKKILIFFTPLPQTPKWKMMSMAVKKILDFFQHHMQILWSFFYNFVKFQVSKVHGSLVVCILRKACKRRIGLYSNYADHSWNLHCEISIWLRNLKFDIPLEIRSKKF